MRQRGSARERSERREAALGRGVRGQRGGDAAGDLRERGEVLKEVGQIARDADTQRAVATRGETDLVGEGDVGRAMEQRQSRAGADSR